MIQSVHLVDPRGCHVGRGAGSGEGQACRRGGPGRRWWQVDSGHVSKVEPAGCAREMGLKVHPRGSPRSWVNGGVTQSGLWASGRAGDVAGPLAPGLLAPVTSVLVIWPPGHDAHNTGLLCHLPKSHHSLVIKPPPAATSHCPHGGESRCSGGPWSGRAGEGRTAGQGSPFLEDAPGGKRRFQ